MIRWSRSGNRCTPSSARTVESALSVWNVGESRIMCYELGAETADGSGAGAGGAIGLACFSVS